MDEEHGTDHSTAGFSAERIGRNDAIFRKANESISEVAEAASFSQPVPFFCECADPACRDIVRLSVEDYRAVREDPITFFNVPGHEASAQGWARVIETHDNYVVVAKIGPAAAVAEQLEGEDNPSTAAVDGDR